MNKFILLLTTLSFNSFADDMYRFDKEYKMQRICFISDDGQSCTEPGTGRQYKYVPSIDETGRGNNIKGDSPSLEIDIDRLKNGNGVKYSF